MKCKQCGSSWNSSIEPEKCPFCGAVLKEDINDIPSVISYMVSEMGNDVLLSPNIVMSYVMDLVKGHDREKKLFRMGCNSGTLERIHKILAEPKQSGQESLVLNLKQYLMNNVFMSEENAIELIDMSLQGVGLMRLKLSMAHTVAESSQHESKAEFLTNAELIEQQNPVQISEPLQHLQNAVNEIMIKKQSYSDTVVGKSSPKKNHINVPNAVRPSIVVCDCNIIGLNTSGQVVVSGLNYHNVFDVANWNDIVAIGINDSSCVVGLKSNGTAVAAGFNYKINVSNWKDIVSISVGGHHTVAVKSDGTAVVLGKNKDKQFQSILNWHDLIAVAAGTYHTIGLKSNGTVVAAGSNIFNICDVEDWQDIVSIAVGTWHTVGLKSDGTVVAVGEKKHSKCDVYGWRNIVAIAASENHTVGLKSDGTVVAVGKNKKGECNVSNWNDIVAIAACNACTVGIKSDGTVVTVGDNSYKKFDVSNWNLLQ